ncbi:hypothetical protein FACS1894214_2320 [Planctomycetales bacterium]|nr:hypothetical protein FACS1894214_2320 [Planctomycetales bacterium]
MKTICVEKLILTQNGFFVILSIMEERKATYEELEALVKTLLLRIDKLETMLFGKKSEKSKNSRASDKKVTSEDKESKESRPKNGGGGRHSFPPNI